MQARVAEVMASAEVEQQIQERLIAERGKLEDKVGQEMRFGKGGRWGWS